MRTRTTATAILLGVASVALIAAGTAAAKTTQLQADLSGANEVPGPGDPDGTGVAFLDVTQKPGKKNGTVCFFASFQGVAPIAGHVHEGAAGTDGPIVIPVFESPASGPVLEDCLKEKRGLLRRLLKDPSGFYVNLHSTEFPGGAIRGQLRFAP